MRLLPGIVLLLHFLCAPAVAQQETRQSQLKSNAVKDSRHVDSHRIQDQKNKLDANLWQTIYLKFPNSRFAAKDGNYVAQNEKELQTYYDLKMDYQYIESETIREVLNLESGEGIIIESCDDSGEGYSAGFREGDLVLQVCDEPVDTQYDFVIAITGTREEGEGTAIVRRAGKEIKLNFSIPPVEIQKSYRWIIGVSVDEMDELLRSHLKLDGAVVTFITAESPAEKMSLKKNDIITRIDEREIRNLDDLREAVQASEGNPVRVDLLRSGNNMSVELTPKKVEVSSTALQQNVPAISHYYPIEHSFQLQSKMATRREMPQSVVNDLIDTAETTVETESIESLSRQVQELRRLIEELTEKVSK